MITNCFQSAIVRQSGMAFAGINYVGPTRRDAPELLGFNTPVHVSPDERSLMRVRMSVTSVIVILSVHQLL